MRLAIRHSLPTHLQSVYILADSLQLSRFRCGAGGVGGVRNGAVQFEYNLPAPQVVELTAGDDSFQCRLNGRSAKYGAELFSGRGEFGTIYV